jgi:hypothetical protein
MADDDVCDRVLRVMPSLLPVWYPIDVIASLSRIDAAKILGKSRSLGNAGVQFYKAKGARRVTHIARWHVAMPALDAPASSSEEEGEEEVWRPETKVSSLEYYAAVKAGELSMVKVRIVQFARSDPHLKALRRRTS